MDIKFEKTTLGRSTLKFRDCLDTLCSIREGIDQSKVWFGIHNSFDTTPGTLPRMRLSQEQVKALLPHLQFFANHGYLPNEAAHNQRETDYEADPREGTMKFGSGHEHVKIVGHDLLNDKPIEEKGTKEVGYTAQFYESDKYVHGVVEATSFAEARRIVYNRHRGVAEVDTCIPPEPHQQLHELHDAYEDGFRITKDKEGKIDG